ncbi:MAG TPA: DNA-processing protein DprA [Gemmatimonadaceae bacterium]|nr:DNA-processing protein DprA [Gemmatimonadaceae bacterium]
MRAASNPSGFPDERRAILALSLVADVGPVTHRQLTERFGSALRALAEGVPSHADRANEKADSLLSDASARGLRLVTAADTMYPQQLLNLYDPPPVLWSCGDWSALRAPVIAVVGTRRATSYGLRATQHVVSALARAGATIVSGMALGIDAAAHRAALDVDGKTVAVLGTGADVAYPRRHGALHREIADRGLIISEVPPGSKSDPGSFPRRNRIIAALASLTIVAEAPIKSGALITSRDALDLGRDVAAIPGPIDSPQSEGSNELIRDGAHVITSASDAIRLVGLKETVAAGPTLTGEAEARVWNALSVGGTSLDDLCARAELPVAQCLTAVTGLELRGLVECAITGEVRRR